MRGINGKVAVVTGGAGGIGAAICRRFGEEGASVAVFDINQDAAEAVAGTIRESGGAARAYAVDLTSQESVVAAVAGVEGELGPIDIMVNNAGWDRAGAFLDTDKESVGADRRGQPVRAALHAPRGAEGHGRAGRWTRRQHRVGRRARRLLGRSRLRLLQGRPRRLLEDDGPGACPEADQRQRRLPRPDRHGAVRAISAAKASTATSCAPAWPAPFPSAASASRTTCRASSSSCPATTPRSSPVRSSAFPAA